MIVILIASVILVLLFYARQSYLTGDEAWERLNILLDHSQMQSGGECTQGHSWREEAHILSKVEDRLGRCGYYGTAERRGVILLLAVASGLTFLATVLFFKLFGLGLIGVLVGLYLGAFSALFVLRYLREAHQRVVLFQIPLVLESLILLVESGLGLLPAIERVSSQYNEDNKDSLGARRKGEDWLKFHKVNPVSFILSLVYQLSSHGMPFSKALELVADTVEHPLIRHVLLHLDISGEEGGELIPSLRSLSDHAHSEWKLSVENRVKKLENMVVFPVFASVIGLLLLSAAVPMVPLLEFRESIRSEPAASGDFIGGDRD